MLDEMPSDLLYLWMEFERVEPFENRADLRAGIIAARVANNYRGEKQKAVTPQDMVPWLVIDDGESRAEEVRKTVGAESRSKAESQAVWDSWFGAMKESMKNRAS